MTISFEDFHLDCTGDVVTGDTILFTEATFGGSFRNPKYLGDRRLIAEVVRDSYGDAKQQHTFTLFVLASDGVEPVATGTKITRKGRNVYRNGTRRLRWPDESARRHAAEEKHTRGAEARARRAARREEREYF
ncbi:MAG: hypothetical protein KGH75_00925 [Rhodospirillales bacterium]|nr:hypothetical protein [Rhodospirillales bacterium]